MRLFANIIARLRSNRTAQRARAEKLALRQMEAERRRKGHATRIHRQYARDPMMKAARE